MSVPASGWSRLHPLTPVLRSGRFVLAALAVLTQQGLQNQPPAAVLVGILAASLVVGGLFGYLSWRTTSYRLTDTELQVDSGLLQKRNRRVPLARLQSVDVVRPLLGRVLGLSEVRLEVAGGGNTEAPLAYLTEQDALRLRIQLLARASGAHEAKHEPAEALLVQVPTRALIVSLLLGGPAVLAGAMLVALVVVLFVSPTVAVGVAAVAVPVGLALLVQLIGRLLTEYGFTVAESEDGLRLRHGLLETRAQTIPVGRVQTVRIREPLLWRRQGWVRVEVDVAGYVTRGQESLLTTALLPVAPKDFALALVERVLGSRLPPVDRPVPRRARYRAPLSARVLAIGLDAEHVLSQWGLVNRRSDVVPLAKVQSLRWVQGPWQRRLGLAGLHVDSAGRRLPGAYARHRDADEAAALLVELRTRTGAARDQP